MRILIVYTHTPEDDNPFVSTLKNALERCGAVVEWGTEIFWRSSEYYDIVFFQWPEAAWDFSPIDEICVTRLKNRIAHWKNKGAKIAYTRHNSMSHTVKSTAMQALYRLIETSCDIMFHMGEYSLNEYTKGLVNDSTQRHVVVPHHTTETINRCIDRKEAREHLKLPADSKVVLCFGSFRNNAERYFVLEGFRRLRVNKKVLLAPILFPGRILRRNPFGVIINIAKQLPFLVRYGVMGSFFESPFVSDDELPYYFASADVVLIQRLKILNSGNLPMGYYFGKVVVGPNIGNVGEILKKSGNPTFEPTDIDSLTRAIMQALSSDSEEIGVRNRVFAENNWNSAKVSEKIFHAFQNLLDETI